MAGLFNLGEDVMDEALEDLYSDVYSIWAGTAITTQHGSEDQWRWEASRDLKVFDPTSELWADLTKQIADYLCCEWTKGVVFEVPRNFGDLTQMICTAIDSHPGIAIDSAPLMEVLRMFREHSRYSDSVTTEDEIESEDEYAYSEEAPLTSFALSRAIERAASVLERFSAALSALEVGKPVSLWEIAEAADASPTNDERSQQYEEGPLSPDKWVYQGKVYERMTRKPWLFAEALWDRKPAGIPVADLAEPVNGDGVDVPTAKGARNWSNNANVFSQLHGIPLTTRVADEIAVMEIIRKKSRANP